jgi:hypothetical protein
MRIENTGSAAASIASAHSPANGTSSAASPSSANNNSATTTTAIDPATGQPVPPKYPWITRLTVALEQNAQKEKASPFKPAEIVGETLNRLA